MRALTDAIAWGPSSFADDRLGDDWGGAAAGGFDLMPYRAARIRARRRRARIGCLAALACGLIGAQLLHVLAERQRQADDARRLGLERRLRAMAPELDELTRLERRVAADDARRARLVALQPRRWQLMALLDGLAAAAQDGIAVTEAVIADDDLVGEVFVAGLADDADVVARWATRLAGHGALDAVSLDELRRLKTSADREAVTPVDPAQRLTLHGGHERSAAQGLNLFRIRGRMRERAHAKTDMPQPSAAVRGAVTGHRS